MIAERAGAHRVELCADPAEGGTTPAFGTIRTVKEKVDIPVYPIIRPRGGDFLYDEEEFYMMKNDVLLCRELGCEGVVVGLLQPDGTIDKLRTAQLVRLAYPMDVTFHRAFDRAANPFEALEAIIETGCKRVLTSGQQPTAREGEALIAELVRQANNRISIMPGSGIRASNITEIAQKTGAREFHSSAKITTRSPMCYVNENMKESLLNIVADKIEVALMKTKLIHYFNAASRQC
jgi:copper homeostasis protein